MASILPQDVIDEDFLRCSLCSSPYSNPKLLPCLHTYCLKCLHSYIERTAKDRKFKCPKCCILLMIPEKGIGAFKTNTFIASLQDIVESQSSDIKVCDNCPTNPGEAKYHCLDCKLLFCVVCRDAHHWLKVTKGHRVVTIGELQSGKLQSELKQRQIVQCEAHPDKPLQSICLQCDRGVCGDCQLTIHNGHRLGDLSQAAQRDRSLIQSLSESVHEQRNMFENSLNAMNNYVSHCNSAKESVLERLEEHRNHLHLMLDLCHAELAKQIEDIYEEETKAKDLKRREIQAIMSAMDHQKDFTTKLLKHGKDQDIITMGKILKVSLNNYSFLQPPVIDSKLQVFFKTPDVDKGRLLPMFGRIVRKQTNMKYTDPNKNGDTTYHSKHSPTIARTFSAKTEHDQKGSKPTAITVAPNDDIILVDDINKKLKIFNENGDYKSEICPQGPDALIDPWDVAVTKEGNYAVTDKGAHNVKIFSPDGQLVTSFGDHLRCPWGLTVNSKGNIIVTDPAAQCIYIHEGQNGKILFTIQCNDQSSMFLCPEYITTNQNDDILISDFDRHCIMAFDNQGRFLYRYGTKGNSIHEFNVPCGLCSDNKGNIFVTDYTNQRIHLITSDGQFKCFTLTKDDNIHTPQDVSVNSKGNLVVVDGSNIKIFSYPSNADLRKRKSMNLYNMPSDVVTLDDQCGPNESDI